MKNHAEPTERSCWKDRQLSCWQMFLRKTLKDYLPSARGWVRYLRPAWIRPRDPPVEDTHRGEQPTWHVGEVLCSSHAEKASAGISCLVFSSFFLYFPFLCFIYTPNFIWARAGIWEIKFGIPDTSHL